MSEGVDAARVERRYYPPGRTGWWSRWRARSRERRIARWTRPRPPRDWRWVVGGIGRTLIILGLLMFGFVAYQLWGTAIQTAQAQSDLKHEFRDLLATQTTVPPVASTTSVVTTTVRIVTSPVSIAVPTTAAPIATSSGPVAAAAQRPQRGDPIALIDAPEMNLHNFAVVEGVGLRQLADGVGHFPETPLPGELGNAVIAGHRTSHAAPFYDIDKLRAGDTITLQTLTGRFVYAVTGTEIVGSDDASMVLPTLDPAKASLTLVSCHPKLSTRQRYVVRADLIIEQSAAPAPPPPVTVPPADISTVPLDSTPTTDGGTAAAGTPTSIELSPESSEAFSQGWFGDPGAWWHVVGWGGALAAVASAGWMVARRFRRYWVGIATAAVPFVVVLYFWYENVNRLLPPGF